MSLDAGRILVVDDEPAIRRLLRSTLGVQDYVVLEAASVAQALEVLEREKIDLIILDLGLPDGDGFEVINKLRPDSQVPIVVLSSRDDERGKVQALDAGADDYVMKPFQMRELTARIRAAVRRVQTPAGESEQRIRIGEIVLDPSRRYVEKAGQIVSLTPKEFDLLHYLMAHAGVPVNHGRLLTSVWGPEYASRNEYLRTFIRQLRKKLEDNPTEPKYLITDSHVGYRFAADAASLSPSTGTFPVLGSAVTGARAAR